MAIEYLLRIDGINGDSTRRGFEGAIEVISWSWGVSQIGGGPGHGAGAAAGRPDFDELQVVAAVSSASPQLVESCVTGRHHRTAALTGLRSGGDADLEFVRYELGDVTVTSIEHGDADDGEPVEELALAYREFSITFTAQRPDGSAGGRTTFSHP